ncbi:MULTISPECIES: hypothetical protein [unclassified Janthinobacterium]|uniref:hypothetical protein n=1 Tax=unclassified Janthinobacterium TaxID=2610881 RepID=UPI00034CDF35|nr:MULTISPECIES: hypothetical protein [unclassified Janthinobacterium]MEC5161781.1 hypothetical protein [Janthinobacterium sp. CG_S6]
MSLIKRLFANSAGKIPGAHLGCNLCLHLAPRQLGWALRQRGRIVPGSAGRIAIDNPDGHWQLPLAAFDAWLRQPGRPGAGLPLSISLASGWCRMALAPWSDALLSEPAGGRYLQSQLVALYGEGARGWSISADDAGYGQPRLVCGVDGDFLQSLRELAGAHGLPCHAIEPLLTVAWRAIAATKPQAFAVVEPGRLLMAAVSGGRIVALHAQACPDDWRAELARAWQRWSLRAPELATLARVAVVDLSGASADAAADAPGGALAAPFVPAAAAMAQLGPVHLMGESAWA